MVSVDYHPEKSITIALSVNIARIIIYILVLLAYLQDFFEQGTPYNSLNISVPGLLAILDAGLIILCFMNRRVFWNISPLASIIAMIISANTAWRFFETGEGVTFLGDFILILAVFMFLISLFELISWVTKEKDLLRAINLEEESKRSEYRSYNR